MSRPELPEVNDLPSHHPPAQLMSLSASSPVSPESLSLARWRCKSRQRFERVTVDCGETCGCRSGRLASAVARPPSERRPACARGGGGGGPCPSARPLCHHHRPSLFPSLSDPPYNSAKMCVGPKGASSRPSSALGSLSAAYSSSASPTDSSPSPPSGFSLCPSSPHLTPLLARRATVFDSPPVPAPSVLSFSFCSRTTGTTKLPPS